jgi:hypothetical protein
MNDTVNVFKSSPKSIRIAHIANDFLDVIRQIVGPPVGVNPLLQGIEDADLVAVFK